MELECPKCGKKRRETPCEHCGHVGAFTAKADGEGGNDP